MSTDTISPILGKVNKEILATATDFFQLEKALTPGASSPSEKNFSQIMSPQENNSQAVEKKKLNSAMDLVAMQEGGKSADRQRSQPSMEPTQQPWKTDSEDRGQKQIASLEDRINSSLEEARSLVAQAINATNGQSSRQLLAIAKPNQTTKTAADALSKSVNSTSLQGSSLSEHSIFSQFLSLLSDAQDHVNGIVRDFSAPGKDFSAREMMSIQQKLAFVEMQITIFSNGMGKILENIKTLMSVQS